MTDNLRDRIAAVIGEHVEDQLTNYDAGRNECGCGHQGDDIYRQHLADAVIADLGLRRASRPNDYDHRDYPPGDRYTTDWIATRQPRSAAKLGLTGDGK